MPRYIFKDTNTGEITERDMKMSERDAFLSENPEIKQLPCAPMVVDPYNAGRMKTSSDFNSLLKGMKSSHKNNTINTW